MLRETLVGTLNEVSDGIQKCMRLLILISFSFGFIRSLEQKLCNLLIQMSQTLCFFHSFVSEDFKFKARRYKVVKSPKG